MGHRSLWLFAIAAAAGIALLLGRSCADKDASTSSAGRPSPSAVIDAGAGQPAQAARTAQGVDNQRQQAMSAAVDTLHRYLAALSSQDRAKADAFWVDQRPPAQTNEADLRGLKGLRALRIQNRTPRPLDSEPVPAALEIPIELRASIDDAANRHYHGWYRLRSSNPVKGDWEITSASVRVGDR